MRGPTGQRAQGSRGSTGNIEGYKRISNFSPEQMDLFRQLFGHLSPDSYTSRLAESDEGLFEEMEAPALRQFAGLQGNIASRFSGMGTGGRHSSGFQNTLTSASSNFAQDLQSQRQGLQRQAIKDLFGMGSELLGQQPYSYLQKQPSFLENLLGFGAQGAGQVGGAALMNKILPFLGL